MSMQPEMETGVTTCGNCHAPMPKELRFCRNCGFRLGEGSAEYTETVRFQNVPPGTLPANGAAQYQQHQYGGMAGSPGGPLPKRKKRMSGMRVVFIGFFFFFFSPPSFHPHIPPHS